MQKLNLNNLPVYDIVINDDDETGIRLISLVDDPAIEIKGMCLSKNPWTIGGNTLPPIHPNCRCYLNSGDWHIEPDACELCIEKKAAFESGKTKKNSGPSSKSFSMQFSAVKDKQIIVGPVLVPNKHIFRSDNEGDHYIVFSEETIRKMVNKFNKGNNNRSINLDHSDKMVDGYIQASWITENPVYDKSKFYGYDLPVGSFFIEVKIDDRDFWENEVKTDLGFFSFSVEGFMGYKLQGLSSQCCDHTDFKSIIEEMGDAQILQLANEIATGKILN